MSYVFNAHRLLKTVRSDEVNDPKFKFTDAFGREITHEGDLVRLSDIKRMHDAELERYREYVQGVLFFGEAIPEGVFPMFDIEDLVDNLNNNAVGYSFIDDPKNKFQGFRDSYGAWLLSDPERAEKYVYIHEGKLTWHIDAAMELLGLFDGLREILAPGSAYSTLLQVRCSEFARANFRNTTGAPRNLRIECHILCYVATQDKTSHLHLRDRNIPHAFTRPWAVELIHYFSVFRPFEELLVENLMDKETLHRYRIQLWPGLKRTLTSEQYGDYCGAVTKRYLKKPFKPLLWRSLMTAFAKYLPKSKAFEASKEYFVDMSMMHSTSMSNNRYGRTVDQTNESDFRVTIGCIQAGLDFQKHVGIGQERPFTLNGGREDPPESAMVPSGQ